MDEVSVGEQVPLLVGSDALAADTAVSRGWLEPKVGVVPCQLQHLPHLKSPDDRGDGIESLSRGMLFLVRWKDLSFLNMARLGKFIQKIWLEMPHP